MDTARGSRTKLRRHWTLARSASLRQPAPRRRFLRGALAVVLAAMVAAAGVFWWPALAAGWLTTLPVVEARRTPLDGAAYEYSWPQDSGPAIVRVGGAPTPLGASWGAENDRFVVVSLFEDLGSLTLIVIDKQTLAQREAPIPGTKFAYGLCFDRSDDRTLWIGCSLRAALYRLDLASGELQWVWEPPDDSHIFGLDQAADGALYLGTYPGRRCWRVEIDGSAVRASLVEVESASNSTATYLYRVAAADESLLLSYSAPAVLLRHDPRSGQTGELFRSTSPFIELMRVDDRFWAQDGDRWRCFDLRGQEMTEDSSLPPMHRAAVEIAGERALVRVGDRTAEISLQPRAGGMGITALDPGNGRLYGATYWNTWLFEIDPAARVVRGRGALPGGSGEFFHSAWHGGRQMIPSYQGLRFEFAPAPAAKETQPFKLAGHVEQAHYGTSSATMADGSWVYATFPNYHQPGGKLVFVDPQGEQRVVERIGDDLTLGQLAVVGDRLFGGTIAATGSGMARRSAQPPRIVELDGRGSALRAWSLGDRGDDVVGIAPLDGSRLLCATKRRLAVVDIAAPESNLRELPLVRQLKRLYASPVRRLVPYGEQVLIVTAKFLLSYDPQRDELRPLARLPEDCTLAGVGGDGGLYLSDRRQLWLIPRPTLSALGL